MRKKMAVTVGALLLSILVSFPALAFGGKWVQGTGENAGKWKYELWNGKCLKGSVSEKGYVQMVFSLIDGDKDGVAEQYYFDQDGWLYTDTDLLPEVENSNAPMCVYVDENGRSIVVDYYTRAKASMVNSRVTFIELISDWEDGEGIDFLPGEMVQIKVARPSDTPIDVNKWVGTFANRSSNDATEYKISVVDDNHLEITPTLYKDYSNKGDSHYTKEPEIWKFIDETKCVAVLDGEDIYADTNPLNPLLSNRRIDFLVLDREGNRITSYLYEYTPEYKSTIGTGRTDKVEISLMCNFFRQ